MSRRSGIRTVGTPSTEDQSPCGELKLSIAGRVNVEFTDLPVPHTGRSRLRRIVESDAEGLTRYRDQEAVGWGLLACCNQIIGTCGYTRWNRGSRQVSPGIAHSPSGVDVGRRCSSSPV
jgi:hypothetical protein